MKTYEHSTARQGSSTITVLFHFTQNQSSSSDVFYTSGLDLSFDDNDNDNGAKSVNQCTLVSLFSCIKSKLERESSRPRTSFK